MTQSLLQPHMNTRADAAFRFFGVPCVVRSTSETTGGTYALFEHFSMPPGLASPLHVHTREHEAFYVLDGEIAVYCGGQWLKGSAGSYIFGPMGVPHGFRVIGSRPASILLLCAPGGFEKFVMGLAEPGVDGGVNSGPPDFDRMVKVATENGIEILGPLPDTPAELEATTDIRTLTERWIDAFNRRDWAAEAASRTPGFVAHLSGMPQAFDSGQWSTFLQGFTESFPDSKITSEQTFADGNFVTTRWTITGTHRGEFQGVPPSGKPVQFSGIEINRFEGVKVAEHWAQFDMVALMQQIGAMPGM